MGIRNIIAIIVLLVGIAGIGCGFYIKSEMAQARSDIDNSTGLVPDNPVKSAVKGGLNRKVDEYRLPAMICFTGGGILVIVGAVTFFYRKKNG